jgi:O-antigen ligase
MRKLGLLTPPTELRDMICKIGAALTSYPSTRLLVRLAIALVVFVVGIIGVFANYSYALRAAFGSLVVLALLRYHYLLLLTWVFLDAFIGSTIPIFNGGKLDTALTAPTILLMLYLPVRQTLKRMPVLIFLFIFLVWVFASIGISRVEVGAFLTIWTLLLDYVAVSILAINVLTTEKRLLRLIDVVLLVSTSIAIYGIYGYITKQNVVADTQNSLLLRAGSIFGNAPTVLAFFLSITIPLAIYRTFLLQGFKRLAGLLLILISLVALALTFTRGAYISVPLSVIVLTLCLPSRRMKITLLSGLLGLGLLLLLLVNVGHLPILERFFNSDVSTFNGRTLIWQALIDHFNPAQVLGNGWDASSMLLTSLQGGVRGLGGTAAHSLYLGTLYDQGIIGFILLLLVFITLFVSLVTGIRKTAGHQRTLFAIALSVFASMVVQSIDSNEIWNQSVGLYFWIIMALPFANCWSTPEQLSSDEQDDLNAPTEPRMAVERQGTPEPISPGTCSA